MSKAAKIFDISHSYPQTKDQYFLDTNVWYWLTYCGSKNFYSSRKPAPYQLEKYPNFVEKIQDKGAKIYHCPLTYTELANIIESAEYEEYLTKNSHITKKAFRKIEAERKNVVKEIDAAWKTICSMSECLTLEINADTINATHSFLSTSILDSYDALFIHFMKSHDIKMLVSDDSDMVSVEVDKFFTANRKVLRK
ncbi:PIN domain-containing protein [Acinetobacter sp. TR11]|uniref:PIN domain-containing protein n=1 Tax=Acinetobacter sp. TR11 TaxID=3003393 RepID=UPI0022ABEA47|nr:PIN domain-containing protein [Acinetobacter sp. TR11]WAU73456.1 PIN domain-containing protein [Acinetobacter sp. TR11]